MITNNRIVGIYKITSPSGKVYIGQSWDIKHRWANYGPKTSIAQRKLHYSFNKYGKKAHTFEIVHALPNDIDQSILNTYEQLYMDFYRDAGFTLLNLREAGANGRPSEQSIELMRAKLLGKTPWNKGLKGMVKMSNETKHLQSIIKKGKHPNNYGKSRSKSAIDSQREKVTGLKRTDAQKLNIGLAGKGRPYHGKNNGKVRSLEVRKLHSNIQKARKDNKGESHNMAKLTPSQVIEIRAKYKPRKYSSRKLAREYNMAKTTILDIVNRKIWTHI